jgi:hypothetical protein
MAKIIAPNASIPTASETPNHLLLQARVTKYTLHGKLSMRAPLLPFLFFLGSLAAVSTAAIKPPPGALINPRREMLVMSDNTPARLKNNPAATNPTLADVLDFVATNTINREPYTRGQFVCTEYAVAFHDAAEAAGLRAALVSVAFTEGVGHALNAFDTVDFGRVYIDCTGSSSADAEDHYDTIGYLKVGKPYGRLHVDLGVRWPNRYSGYEDAMAVFRNLSAWDRELSQEKVGLEAAVRELQKQSRGVNRRTRGQLKSAAQGLHERAERYNKMLEYRNSIAKTFRLQYSENKAPVAHIDVFW